MGCLAIFLLREANSRIQVELSSTFRSGLQQLATPLHSVSPLQQLFSQFYGSFNKGACAHFSFFVPRSVARQVAEKIAQCNRALQHCVSYTLGVSLTDLHPTQSKTRQCWCDNRGNFATPPTPVYIGNITLKWVNTTSLLATTVDDKLGWLPRNWSLASKLESPIKSRFLPLNTLNFQLTRQRRKKKTIFFKLVFLLKQRVLRSPLFTTNRISYKLACIHVMRVRNRSKLANLLFTRFNSVFERRSVIMILNACFKNVVSDPL